MICNLALPWEFRPRLPLLAITLGFTTNLVAQDFSLQVKLVNVAVSVTDRNGAIVGGLTRDDFSIQEDGRPQRIAVFERQSERPLNLILAIDTSDSVSINRTLEERAARRFTQAILRPQDRMSLFDFASYVWELVPFTNQKEQIDQGLRHLRQGGGTAFYDTISLGSERLAGRQGRKVLVLVSDGDDTARGATYDQALERALRNEVIIYCLIDVPIEASAGRDLRGEHALITLAEQTGGKSFYVDESGLDRAFAQVSDDLRTQYLLGYYPHHEEPGTNFHRIEVSVRGRVSETLNLGHRTGYYSDSPVSGTSVP
jgi:Ca-activated chloride channel family protein